MAALAVIASGSGWAAEDDPYFVGIDDLGDAGRPTSATAVSPDGTVVVGISDTLSGPVGIRWTAESGPSRLAGGLILPTDIARRGKKSVGNRGGEIGASRLVDGFWRSLETPSTHAGGIATAIASRSGIAVGALIQRRVQVDLTDGSSTVVEIPEPVRWLRDGTPDPLGRPDASSDDAYAIDVSADGSVITGTAFEADQALAYTWTRWDGWQLLEPFNDKMIETSATGISPEGAVVVGTAWWSDFEEPRRVAFRWTEANGVRPLRRPRDDIESQATATSRLGRVVVGSFERRSLRRAFIWTERHGMKRLRLAANCAFGRKMAGALLRGWTLESAEDISANGDTIVGVGKSPNGETRGWVLHIPKIRRVLRKCDALD